MKIVNKLNMPVFSHFIAIIVAGFLLSACEQDVNQAKKTKNRSHRVNTVTVKPENTLIERRFNAVLVAPNTIKISNQIAGTLISMPYRPGAQVKKNEVLIRIDDSLTRAEYNKASASLDKAKQDLSRIERLLPSQLASAEELSIAQTDLKLAQAEVTLKKIQLERSTIEAPFSGVISERHFEPGDSVTPNTHLLTLVDNSELIARSAIPETYLTLIKTGQQVQLNIPALSYQLDARIKTIFPTVDSKTQQIPIEVSFNDQGKKLYPGLFAEVIINSSKDNIILIPVNAVQYDSQGSWVYTVDKSEKAVKTNIKTGKNIGSRMEIVGGLQTDDIVITKGFVGLSPGKKVTSVSNTRDITK